MADEKIPKQGDIVNFEITEMRVMHGGQVKKTQTMASGVIEFITTPPNMDETFTVKIRNKQQYHRITIDQITHIWEII